MILFAALLGAAQALEPNPNESLFLAIQRADTAAVERLLQNGVSPNAVPGVRCGACPFLVR